MALGYPTGPKVGEILKFIRENRWRGKSNERRSTETLKREI